MTATLNLAQAVGKRMLVWFRGTTVSEETRALLNQYHVAGVTLFRHLNGSNPAGVRALIDELQAAARVSGQPLLLICVDQEGGQLQALAGTTAFPGNMALGATGSVALAQQVGTAIGRELAAVGVNVNYAPVCDVNSNPKNPVIGVRSFGEDPAQVAKLAAAMIDGMQSVGVAATAKHFPGHGDTAADSHNALESVPHSRERLAQVELPPFRAAIEAGVKLVMSAHLALPALNGHDLPATMSSQVLHDLLRGELQFGGVVVSDAMNMGAVSHNGVLHGNAARAATAGIDLLLLAEHNDIHAIYHELHAAAEQNKLGDWKGSAERVLALKHWLAAQPQPGLETVGCAEHRALAAEVAARAITLVRDEAGILPLRLPAQARIAVVTPETRDLTPADTSSYERCELVYAMRRYYPHTEEWRVSADPGATERSTLRDQLSAYDLTIVGTINADTQTGQAALVNELLEHGVPVVAAALRLPYDLVAYPTAPTYLCTYSLLPPSMDALADAICGRAAINGRLPVSIPQLYPIGHGCSQAIKTQGIGSDL